MYYASGNVIKELFAGTTHLPLLWETPYFDFDVKNARKMSNYIYFRAKGNGKIRFELLTDKTTKTLDVDLTSTETFYRKKIKNKGRIFKLKISNLNNSSFTLVSPEILVEIDED